MHISKILIQGFRNYKNDTIYFSKNINVIIGSNNSGKTNLIQSLRLVIDHEKQKKLTIDDFNKNILIDEIKQSPPHILIEITISQEPSEKNNSEQLSTIGSWITEVQPSIQATLTYKYFLPEKYTEKYKSILESVINTSDAFKLIDKHFLSLYVAKIYGGKIEANNIADSEYLQKFDFHFLTAIRDVERDLFTGRHSDLRKVLEFFIDYEIKTGTKTGEEKLLLLQQKEKEFNTISSQAILNLHNRIASGKKIISEYSISTGASILNESSPDFEGEISESDLFSALRLIIKLQSGIEIPATHNGLGYNNLIYISILLAKLQENSNPNYLDTVAKTFSLLAIEEPESHLHPSMQYKFLKFLQETSEKRNNQLFITTHSTQITSATSLGSLICLENNGKQTIATYPAKVFESNEIGKTSLSYVERFLDATKADMLFARRVIFVEGIAEQLLIDVFARCLGKNLDDHHISVINVGGRYFEHFLKMFDSNIINASTKKIACITDRDPERQDITIKNSSFLKCYPFEYNQNNQQYIYRNHALDLVNKYISHPNIRVFSQSEINGKTLEYEIAYRNTTNNIILTPSISNHTELSKLINLQKTNASNLDIFYGEMRQSDENKRIIESLKSSTLDFHEKIKHLIAARYLNSIGKGENALELAQAISDDVKTGNSSFTVPTYINQAIDWICY